MDERGTPITLNRMKGLGLCLDFGVDFAYKALLVMSFFLRLHILRWAYAPSPPFSPSLISLMVSMDVKHHVYCLLGDKP